MVLIVLRGSLTQSSSHKDEALEWGGALPVTAYILDYEAERQRKRPTEVYPIP